MNNIILIGFMGSGKTYVGKKLANVLNFHFRDTDEMVEKISGESVKDIFSKHGEEYFRHLETNLIKDLTGSVNKTVISVGGGLPIQPGNAELLKKLGTVIYLKTNQDTIKKRLAGDTMRPLLMGDDKEDKMDKLYRFREPLYKAAADIFITTDNREVQEIITNIIEEIGDDYETISD